MPALRLIVHADDFGLSEAVDDGIVEAHDRGIVTSTSVMANGPAFAHAVALARARPALDVGLHLTLTELEPLTRDSPALAGAANRLPPHAVQFAARYLRGRIPLADVRRELEAQIRTALDAGLAVSHLDGHQHVHVLPGVARVVVELARAYGIRAVRCPAERVRLFMLRGGARVRRIAEQLAVGAAAVLSPLQELKRVDAFVGFFHGGRLTEENLTALLAALPNGGTVELMCHPGRDDPGSAFNAWGYRWSAETAALTSPSVRGLLERRGIELISYRDV
ncbi:MAG TPA: ChbG/HpnK family deacetylase [Gammaproteobacteria bacterium]